MQENTYNMAIIFRLIIVYNSRINIATVSPGFNLYQLTGATSEAIWRRFDVQIHVYRHTVNAIWSPHAEHLNELTVLPMKPADLQICFHG